MYFILVIVIVFIITIYIFNYIIFKRKRNDYLNAAKKWDEIVKELSKRK